MNHYLDALLQMQIEKLNELKDKGATDIPIDTVLKLLDGIQKVNKGIAPDTKFNTPNDKEQ